MHSTDQRSILAGGSTAVLPDGRPLPVAVSECRALIRDRGGRHQCRRRGWFALQACDGRLVQPLCATHLRRLAAHGGQVVG